MGRARRQLPLYEVLSQTARRTGAVRPVPVRSEPTIPPPQPFSSAAATSSPVLETAFPTAAIASPEPETVEPTQPEPELKPVVREPFRRTHAPASVASQTTAAAHSTPIEPGDGALRLPTSTLLIMLAVLIAVVAVAWTIAFKMGGQAEAAKMGEQFPDAPAANGAPGPAPNNGGAGTPQVPKPAPGAGNTPAKPVSPAPANASDPRIPGYNYLYLGTLTERDAAAGTAFLTQNGVPAFYVVDRSRGAANNPPCRIYAEKGVSSDRFRDSQRERDELVRKVEEVGRRWQREQKGASDFRQPYWTLHKG